ncbi:MAG: SRPBCC family protein [Bacteroidales bacterium]|nr:SRPBCC family protein [Bacteroidales bacterium]
MDNFTKYESRIGKIKSGAKEVFDFVTDMRNFKQFLPERTIQNWEAGRDECSFEVSPVGTSKINIVRTDPDHTVKYAGHGLNNTEFYLWVQLKEIEENDTRVRLTIKAGLNPAMKMVANKPIKDFLDKLVKGMEDFEDWKKTND